MPIHEINLNITRSTSSISMHETIPVNKRKSMLIKFSIILSLSIISANLAVVVLLTYFPNLHYSITVVSLNVTAWIASATGFITVYRYGFHGIHGQSLLFLTLGIASWSLADLSLAYGHFVLHFEEEQSLVVSYADLLWLIGYAFLSMHLFSVLRLVRRSQIHALTIISVIILCGLSIVYNIMFSSQFLNPTSGGPLIVGDTKTGFADLLLSLVYILLDLIFIVPSVIILTASRRDYFEFIPWMLFSLSLLTNAIADQGFMQHFIQGVTSEMWIWELFYMTDYLIITGAFFWYNGLYVRGSHRSFL